MTSREQQIVDAARQLWLDVLPDSTAGTFTACGGDSLTGLRLLGAVYKTFDVRLPFEDLTSAEDVNDFARHVAEAISA